MTRDELVRRYFDWMCKSVATGIYAKRRSYRKLLHHLNSLEFNYIIAMDGNRAEDGADLRYRFGYEKKYEGAMIATYLDDRPCSILEMMVALAVRCEEHIMDDPDIGNRTGKWFWDMIESLGLGCMSDGKFDIERVNEIVWRFIYREYERNGKGGLFTIKDLKRDLRSVEIWYQMCWYLDEIL